MRGKNDSRRGRRKTREMKVQRDEERLDLSLSDPPRRAPLPAGSALSVMNGYSPSFFTLSEYRCFSYICSHAHYPGGILGGNSAHTVWCSGQSRSDEDLCLH